MSRVLVVFVIACGHASLGGQASPRPSEARPLREQPAGSGGAPADRAAAVAPATPPATRAEITRVEVQVLDSRFELHHGNASFDGDWLTLQLTADPVDCGIRREMVGGPTRMDAELTVRIASGPGGHFFAGHPVGFNTSFRAPRSASAGSGAPAIPLDTGLRAPVVALELQPSTWTAGSRLRGTIEGEEDRMYGATKISGTFDVELCTDARDPRPLPDTAPAEPARGMLGHTPLVPRTVYAIIEHHGPFGRRTPGVAWHADHAGIPEIAVLVFSAQADAPCPQGVMAVLENPPMLYVRNLGGTAAERMLTGAQPADAFLASGGRTVVWPAWVQFDNFAYATGDKVRGSLWASMASDSPQVQGQFGGRFEAVVCDPGLGP